VISREQALEEDRFHVSRPGKWCVIWRRNGKSHTWVRDPARFRTPLKWGLSNYGQLTENGLFTRGGPVPLDLVHTDGDCPDRVREGSHYHGDGCVPPHAGSADRIVFG